MRDTRQSKEYFDQYIQVANDNIKLFDEKFNLLSRGIEVEGNLDLLSHFAFQARFERILARYSRGDEATEIKEDFIESITSFENLIAITSDSFTLKYLSLAPLLILMITINKVYMLC